ncbi:MAG TPA: 2-oxoacid:ferredoxin oxidoreductase subunit gamma [Clostridiales bacterium]|nr:2-oxoacid:ferredoxin oxidoreductase subunit gamma [Clostridiales bacterium]
MFALKSPRTRRERDMRKDIRIGGAGGQGVIMLSVLLANAYGIHLGMEAVQTQSYGPAARGGSCKAEVVVSDAPIDYVKADDVDVLVAFNQVSFQKYSQDVKKDTLIFVDSTLLTPEDTIGFSNVMAIPATDYAEKHFAPVVANIIMFGFMTAKMESLTLEAAQKALKDTLPGKALDMNMKALEFGYRKGME